MIRLATRGSALALTQARLVASLIGDEVEVIEVRTSGDARRAVGDKSRWVKEIEEALLDGRADLAVHSAKDVPGVLPDGLAIVGVPERADPRDVLCGGFAGVAELPQGARVGTSALRRRSQLLAARPDLEVDDLRGNVDTRLGRLADGDFDAIVLAAAGLDRLGLSAEIGHRFGAEELVPEAGQGALALQVRTGEEELASSVDDPETRRRVTAERACVARIGAGCLAPVAAHHDGETLTALIAAEDGSWIERRRGDDPLALADELLAASP